MVGLWLMWALAYPVGDAPSLREYVAGLLLTGANLGWVLVPALSVITASLASSGFWSAGHSAGGDPATNPLSEGAGTTALRGAPRASHVASRPLLEKDAAMAREPGQGDSSRPIAAASPSGPDCPRGRAGLGLVV